MLMPEDRKQQLKTRLHERNKNRERYDLKALIAVKPDLKQFIIPNKSGDDSIDFSNAASVKLLNKAILAHYYGIENWEFSDENLCPPIPGRADYLHYVADLLTEGNAGSIPKGNKITCLDIGSGATCIYPIIGIVEYGWRFIASDSNEKSIVSAGQIIASNAILKGKVKLKLQEDKNLIFQGILNEKDQIDLTICNPPFHASIEEAKKGSIRKIKNLSGKKVKNPMLNFAGTYHELVFEGGEFQFILNMVNESRKFGQNCFWFTTLVSKERTLKKILKVLEQIGALEIKTIPMGTGNKTTRILAWTFFSKKEQQVWSETRWSID